MANFESRFLRKTDDRHARVSDGAMEGLCFLTKARGLLVRPAVRGVSMGRFETATFKDGLMGSRRSVGPLDKWVLINLLPPAESRGSKHGEKPPLKQTLGDGLGLVSLNRDLALSLFVFYPTRRER